MIVYQIAYQLLKTTENYLFTILVTIACSISTTDRENQKKIIKTELN